MFVIVVIKKACKKNVNSIINYTNVLLNNPEANFDILLTVHLSIILVINQLNAQNLIL